MSEEFMPSAEKKEVEEEFEIGDKVIHTDKGGNERTGEITREKGDLHLGENLVEVKFDDDNSVEGVSVEKIRKVKKPEEPEETEILE